MKTKIKTITKRIVCVLGAFVLSLFAIFESTLSINVKAEDTSETETNYTNVLDDLKKDETFKEIDYPVNTSVDEMQVIQIAESSDKELFVYVYQPNTTNNYILSEIRMGFPEVSVKTTYDDYGLTLLSQEGVFFKYGVNGVVVKDTAIRYYDIIQVERPNNVVNSPDYMSLAVTNTVDSIVYEVAQKWAVYEKDGKTVYEAEELEVVTITDKIVGYIRYPDGYYLCENSSVDAHFIAFNTDWVIDEIYEADIEFDWAQYWKGRPPHEPSEKTLIKSFKDDVKTINVEDTGKNDGDGFLGKKYTWKRITTVSQFISKSTEAGKDINFVEGVYNDLEKKQWVINFLDTDYINSYATNTIDWTEVSNVSILRLKFRVGKDVYNLGCVDNEQTGSKDPVGSADTKFDDFVEDIEKKLSDFLSSLGKAFEKIFGILGVALIGIVIAFVIGLIAPFIGPVFRGLWWLISLPFKLIGKLFKKKK